MSNNSNNLTRVKILPPEKIEEAASRLKAGEIGLIPTETFWGLSTNPFILNSVLRLFAIKKRPLNKTVPLMASSIEQVKEVAFLDKKIEPLARDFWPGPLSLLLKSSLDFPCPQVKNEKKEICIRVSSHLQARELASLVNLPLVATSANLSGEPPQIRWQQISLSVLNKVDFILDTPLLPAGGKASTILRLEDKNIHFVRKGALPEKEIWARWEELKKLNLL
ncbi:MAG: L-threonylcarbamoyladenylate synthase [Desulfonauticus sp.]|jgi:L-threonylcarbamoyladenylate synthase|nr:L-threonylcarbamoyladenylate synthase [Desulfonauticus sp.]